MISHSFNLNHGPSKSNLHINEHKAKSDQHSKNLFLTAKALPTFEPSFSLSTKYPLVVLDQGTLGSCVANSFAAIMNSLYGITPSRIYNYFIASITQRNAIGKDNGLDLLQAIPTFKNCGVVLEQLYPYNISAFSKFPPLNIFKIADTTKTFTPTYISQSVSSIQTALLNGQFVMLGILVYSSFLTKQVATTGLVSYPNTSKEILQGGHCVHLVGWCTINNTLYFIARNSWGTGWGNNGAPLSVSSFTYANNGKNGGFFYIPASYVTDPKLAFEFVAISK